jgi:hypothetical protein
VDLAAVSRRLGHGSVAVTAEVYSHLLEDPARRQGRVAILPTRSLRPVRWAHQKRVIRGMLNV